MSKDRLDKIVTKRELFPSRSKAKRAIMAGLVLVNGEIEDKAGTQVEKDADIDVKGKVHPYVSRGGLKLEKALDIFDIDLQDKFIVDIGASTGGFTDCSLQNGAKCVYAIDVGYGQLAWKLRQDDRVVNLERTNARYLKPKDFDVRFNLATIDVAFISLTKILPALIDLLIEEGDIIALIKPQFEAGPEKVNNNGVVKDPAVHKEVINRTVNFAQDIDLSLIDLSFSPITGAQGHNIEYLAHFSLKFTENRIDNLEQKIAKVIEKAQNEL
ncbi:TlyA family RNA methyltransferase [Selenihalanaerobacter shriftii]|uniref:23S rRNA (Cytidine1920-2'-O)/16S rRNA (Cytidine1409-2'-O)-methyltransferase n=1 Tax=Selenihalanaerobacter shriftii TaxID=142842 RepID=A0A1T4P2H6_9FIRM|nr:TlyA family RNA methyltransferase [Selenihalanaerobacter shriftii]SJZ85466.1 23S rRNA (cytidine1920-2'-O)/16S rRNA (cytidine1409-2'-O)-methyltransferase [Selenihalanaerobacter shriftii]